MSQPPLIFFAYKRKDPDFARQIEWVRQGLEREGFDVFIDSEDVKLSTNWVTSLESAITACDLGLVLWTPSSMLSDSVNGEALRLRRFGKYCGIIFNEEHLCVPAQFAASQCGDLSDWDGKQQHATWTDFAGRVRALIAARKKVILPEPHPIVVIPKAKETGEPVPLPPKLEEQPFQEAEDLPLLVKVPTPGRFEIGAAGSDPDAEDNERPVTPVRISHAFAIGVRPISLAEWNLAAASSALGISTRKTAGAPKSDAVVEVSWDEAQAYVAWLNARVGDDCYSLPTEAEWEYAAGCGGTWSGPAAGHSSKSGENPWGLAGVLGNIWQWTADVYADTHHGIPSDGRRRDHPPGRYKSVRGASWRAPAHQHRVTVRTGFDKEYAADDIGFRVVRQLTSRES